MYLMRRLRISITLFSQLNWFLHHSYHLLLKPRFLPVRQDSGLTQNEKITGLVKTVDNKSSEVLEDKLLEKSNAKKSLGGIINIILQCRWASCREFEKLSTDGRSDLQQKRGRRKR